MSNELTDREFWSCYWKSKTDLAFHIPKNYLFHRRLKQIIDSSSIATAIELGGFPGYYAIFLKKYFKVEGTLIDYFIAPDIVNNVLEANNLYKQDVNLIEANIFDYTPQKQYDLVLSCGLIEHFSDTKDIIQCHLSFFKSGGTLFITLPNFKSVNGWVQKNFDKENYDKHYINCMDLQLLNNIAMELGLKDIKVSYYGKFSVWLENKEKNSALTKAFVKFIWYAGKIFTKIFPFESKFLSPYIVLEAKK